MEINKILSESVDDRHEMDNRELEDEGGVNIDIEESQVRNPQYKLIQRNGNSVGKEVRTL